MPGVASAPKTSSQSTNFRSMRPGAKAPGLFSVSFPVIDGPFYKETIRYGNRPPADFACHSRRPGRSPLNSCSRAPVPPGPLASVFDRQANSPDGGERPPPHNNGQDNRNPGDIGTDGRSSGTPAAQAFRAKILVRASRLPTLPAANISVRNPALNRRDRLPLPCCSEWSGSLIF